MRRNARRWEQLVAGIIATVVLFLVCVTSAVAASRQMLWQSRDQFVALEALDKGTGGTNAHPVDVTPDILTALLASVEVRVDASSAMEPLFTPAALQALVPHLAKALQTASPSDDVTFAVIGLHTALYGLAKSPKVTTGRMFKRDGHLNLIIGMAQKDVNEREDRRLAPFIPGSRNEVAEGDWRLLPNSGQNLFTLKRSDWIVFSDEPPPVVVSTPEQPKTILQPRAATTVAPAPVAPPVQTDARGPVERMTILNELRSKGLITEEEYKGKRLQILNGI